MPTRDPYTPPPDDRFTFGLWTVGNPGADPFGGPTRGQYSPAEQVDLLGDVGGAYGVNFHDNDLIPIDATDAEAKQIKRDFRAALRRHKLKVPMATTNLFSDPVFKDGAFTSNDAEVRAYAVQKTMKSMLLGKEFGAKTYVFWGGREGTESDATKDPVVAVKRFRECINYLCAFSKSEKLNYKFAFEAKPNEPRGHMYMATTGNYLAFIETLDDRGIQQYDSLLRGGLRERHGGIGDRRAFGVVGRAADEGRLGREVCIGDVVQNGDLFFHLDHDLGADAVAGKEQERLRCHVGLDRVGGMKRSGSGNRICDTAWQECRAPEAPPSPFSWRRWDRAWGSVASKAHLPPNLACRWIAARGSIASSSSNRISTPARARRIRSAAARPTMVMTVRTFAFCRWRTSQEAFRCWRSATAGCCAAATACRTASP